MEIAKKLKTNDRLAAFLASALILLLLYGCNQPAGMPEVVVTEVVIVEGTPVVVTRVVEQMVEVEVTIEAAPVPTVIVEDPVLLEITYQGLFPPLDPQLATSEVEINLIENLFVGLTRMSARQNNIEPSLATDWETSADGLVWTFHLRDDIRWMQVSDNGQLLQGRAVDAGDVVFAYQRICDPRVNSPYAFVLYNLEGCEVVNRAPEVRDSDLSLVGVEAVDDQTVEFRLVEPGSEWLTITSLWWLRPFPPEVVPSEDIPPEEVFEEDDDWMLPENLWTSGPFVLASASTEGQRTRLARNPLWPLPFSGNVDEVHIFHIENNDEPILSAFELWQELSVDIAPLPSSREAIVLAELTPRYQLVPDQSIFYLAYNFQSEVFQIPEVRRAFGAAIDRDRLINEVYSGRALPMRHFVPVGTIGAVPTDEVGTGYNPDFARQQMRNSPFADCRLMPPIRYLVSSTDLALQHAQMLQQMWATELGCPEEVIQIEQVPFGQLVADTRHNSPNRPDIWDLGWVAHYPDAHGWFGDVLHCQSSENRPNRPCSEVDTQIVDAATTVPLDERWQAYRTIENLFFAQDGLEPITPLFVRAEYHMVQRWMDAYYPTYVGGDQYDRFVVNAGNKELERLD